MRRGGEWLLSGGAEGRRGGGAGRVQVGDPANAEREKKEAEEEFCSKK